MLLRSLSGGWGSPLCTEVCAHGKGPAGGQTISPRLRPDTAIWAAESPRGPCCCPGSRHLPQALWGCAWGARMAQRESSPRVALGWGVGSQWPSLAVSSVPRDGPGRGRSRASGSLACAHGQATSFLLSAPVSQRGDLGMGRPSQGLFLRVATPLRSAPSLAEARGRRDGCKAVGGCCAAF